MDKTTNINKKKNTIPANIGARYLFHFRHQMLAILFGCLITFLFNHLNNIKKIILNRIYFFNKTALF